MEILAEKDYTIDGVKSWIHCLVEGADRPSRHIPKYHNHDYIELLYALTPGAHVWINGACYPFDEGDLILINSQEAHTVSFPAPAKHICVKFSPHILYADEQALLEFKYVIPFLSENRHQKQFRCGELENFDVGALMHEIIREWEARDVGYELVIRADILRLFSGILRYWHQADLSISNMPITDTVKRAMDYLEMHYATATEREVAEACAVSYSHFSRAFKQVLGKSFSDYMTQIRIREAEKLLIFTDKSVTEIAMEVGFSSSSHFISRFGAYRHVTPRQFRANVRGMGIV